MAAMNIKQYRELTVKPRRRPGNTVGPNKTEAAFALWRRSLGYVLEFKAIKVCIGPPGSRCWYTPDWLESPSHVSNMQCRDPYDADVVLETAVRRVFYDVKARSKNGRYRAEDDALVKIKAASRLYPWARWALAWPSGFEDGDPFEILEVG